MHDNLRSEVDGIVLTTLPDVEEQNAEKAIKGHSWLPRHFGLSYHVLYIAHADKRIECLMR